MTRYPRALGGLLALAAVAGGTACARSDDISARQNAAYATADHAAADQAADHARSHVLLRRLTTQDGGPGALVALGAGAGGAVLTSGVADVKSRAPMRGDSRFRIGSMTKPFVATVVLQLVGEGRVVLDAPVERYLPGVVRGHGNDGRQVTVRQLLQHTSGIPDYLDHLEPEDVLEQPAGALRHPRPRASSRSLYPRPFEPGTDWSLLQHGLPAGRHAHRAGDRPPVRRRDPPARHRAAGPASDVRPGRRLGDPRPAPARIRPAGQGRAAPGHHRAQPHGRRARAAP